MESRRREREGTPAWGNGLEAGMNKRTLVLLEGRIHDGGSEG